MRKISTFHPILNNSIFSSKGGSKYLNFIRVRTSKNKGTTLEKRNGFFLTRLILKKEESF